MLSRAITLIESNAPAHQAKARLLIQKVLPRAGHSIRIGITGVPGAGKSTLIESFGEMLCAQGYKVAVLAVDPSSSLSHGSILGDKTRMEKLSRHPSAFIRPSPSGGTLGGVTRKSRESIVLCEAAGFDVILVETVGVGQSETTVRSMVDFFMLVLVAGAGDELQGIKKGIVEMADLIVINKADGENITRAQAAQSEYQMALRYLQRSHNDGWKPLAQTCSAIHKTGIPEIWETVRKFENDLKRNGNFMLRRQQQRVDWVFAMVEDFLKEQFYQNPHVADRLPTIIESVRKGELSTSQAAQDLLDLHLVSNS